MDVRQLKSFNNAGKCSRYSSLCLGCHPRQREVDNVINNNK